jgi:hypothetical protein
MTLIPITVAVIVASILLGGPEDGVRAIERAVSNAWSTIVVFFRH